jgi:hypothetical protein
VFENVKTDRHLEQTGGEWGGAEVSDDLNGPSIRFGVDV